MERSDVYDLRIQHEEAEFWICAHCLHSAVFSSTEDLWGHAMNEYHDKFPVKPDEQFKNAFINDCAMKRKLNLQPKDITVHHPRERAAVQDEISKGSKSRKASCSLRTKESKNEILQSLMDTSSRQQTPTSQRLVGDSRASDNAIILQLETKPISQEQLIDEVKSIYTGLVMVEAMCIEVDDKQAT